MVSNIGGGTSYSLQVLSAQPEIIENEKGLLIAFEILETQLGTEEVSFHPQQHIRNNPNVNLRRCNRLCWLISEILGLRR
jgi:hypothetical protein